MKTLAVAGVPGLLAIVALAAYGGMDTTASRDLSKRKAVADDAGNLHVPDTYRTTYELLGSWAVVADQGQGSKQLHIVYASPGTIAAYRTDGRFPDGAVLVKEVFQTATKQMTTGTVSHAETLKGWFVMMKDGNGSHDGNVVGRRVGMVVVRFRQPIKDNVDRLQDRLSVVSCAGASLRLDLRPWIPAAEAIANRAPHWPAPERAGQEAHQSERRADQLLNFLKSRKFQKDLIWTRPLLRILGRDLLLQKKNIRSDRSPYSLRSAWS